MDVSIFEVVGPVMIGPSSSHTAGAARLARVARLIAAAPFHAVDFGLHGSFAQTYRGHGTDRALVAGALGLREDDERLAESFELADVAGLRYRFHPIELEGVHENTVRMTFSLEDGRELAIVGSSIGGGQILITSIDGFETEIAANAPTLILRQQDMPGVVTAVTYVLAKNGINIGVMKLSRRAKGGDACCIIETDTPIPERVVETLRAVPHVLSVRAIHPDETAEGREDAACTRV